jgi:L-lactate dehydrogenase complex protein LldG
VVELAVVSDARAEMLDRMARALGPTPVPAVVPRQYRQVGDPELAPHEAVELFCARVEDYRATVYRSPHGELLATLAAVCRDRGLRRLACAAGMPQAIERVELVRDDPPLSARALDALDGVLTGCALAIADTGTVILDGSPACGRRALTLVPDYHLCVVRADQVVAGVPDAIAALAPCARQGRPITLISGPSATSDIELDRVEGVHGPRTLDVVLVG